ncbi:polysaccharide deacetylase family protein [Streptomyces sp. NPDC088725]|uniref:polysaccharide deacetylase family protein n=1 Tax=Streptomyces sp. NPDC088725 TaxID=3365873 RepID=UPI0037F905A2
MDASEPNGTVFPCLASELVGYPAGARVLIVNNDDFGMYPAINTAVVRSIEEGIAASCSLMVPAPAAAGAMELLRRRPGIAFGIHLTLVCDLPRHRWGPVAAKGRVVSLLDEAGGLFAPERRVELLGRARLDDVEREFRAQIGAVADAGLTPTHLDWHCLADGGRDDILELTVALAAECGLAVRVWLEPGRRAARRRGLPVVDHDFLDSFALAVDGKAAQYAQLLRDLPAGLSEWAVHPSLGDKESRVIDPGGWRVRRSDYDFLMSEEAREILRHEDIHVIDYRTLQEVWSRTNAPGP